VRLEVDLLVDVVPTIHESELAELAETVLLHVGPGEISLHAVDKGA
jgi:hypothetical protein